MTIYVVLKHLVAVSFISFGMIIGGDWSESQTWLWYLFPFAYYIPIFIFMDFRDWVKRADKTGKSKEKK